MQRIAFWQGAFMPVEQVCVSADDRGYYFGDGVYEVVMAFRGQPFSLSAHLDRFEYSAREARLSIPYPRQELERIVWEALERLPAPQALVYFQLTRGAYPRMHPFPPVETPCAFLLTAQPYADNMIARDEGVRAVLLEDTRWHRCDIKSLNLLPNVLAIQKAAESGAQLAIFVRDGIVTECGSANLFIVSDGVLRTHPLGPDILAGTTRADVLRLAAELGIPCREEPFGAEALFSAQEAFHTSVGTRCFGVVQVDGRPIGDGRVGPVTLRLQEAYDRLILRECP